jgi:hypothetical protein
MESVVTTTSVVSAVMTRKECSRGLERSIDAGMQKMKSYILERGGLHMRDLLG